MKIFTRKQFLTGGASLLFGAALTRLSGQSAAEGEIPQALPWTPDLTAYTEITGLTFEQRGRRSTDGKYDLDSDCVCVGDLFFTPIGTDIVVTLRDDGIVPLIGCGEMYCDLALCKLFVRYQSQGFVWYHCKTIYTCNYLLASCSDGALSVDRLRAAGLRLYIRFPSRVSNTLYAAKIRARGVKERWNRLFTVVHMTDIHGDVDSAHAIYEYADRMGADLVALTGDHALRYPAHGCAFLNSMIRTAKTPSVLSVGNHDVAGISDKTVYERSIAPIREALGASEEHPYYFRDLDYGGQTVRVISLYPFSDKANVRYYGFYSEQQLQWLCEAMASTPEGGHILILRHFSHEKPLPAGDMFYDYADTAPKAVKSLWLNMRRDPVTDVVDAFNERRYLSAQFTVDLKKEVEDTVTVRYDFSKRGDAEFVAYLTGHVHCDHVGYVRDSRTRQAVLGSICTVGEKGTEDYSGLTTLDSPRDYGTDSQIALNVYTFDFARKSIYVARVGNGLYKDQEKTWMKIEY